MSTLRSVLDELRLVDPEGMTIEELADEILELTEACASMEALSMSRLASFERRGGHEVDGYLSATAWLKHKARLGGGAASERVRMARALTHMPIARTAFLHGEVTFSSVRVLVDSHKAHPETFSEHEATLVDAARSLDARRFGSVVAYWRQALDDEAAVVDTNRRHDDRRLHLSDTFQGMVRGDAWFDPEGGEIVKVAVGSIADAGTDTEDDRTAAQRRADALVEICRHWLDRGPTSISGGERPHLSVVVDLEVLERRARGRSELEDGTVLHPETVRRLACDAGVSRVITKGPSEPLDVGRRTRTVSAALRRAVVLRDRCCSFPGCDRPPRWCDVHHIDHWADGGVTALHNLTLLCRRHHRLIHEGGWTIQRGDDGPVFVDPEGRARSP